MTLFPDPMLAHMAGETTTLCHCWRVLRRDGLVLGFTDHDRSLTVGGTPCEPETGMIATETRDSVGLAVDSAEVAGALSSDRITEVDVNAGRYDGATVETWLVNWAAPEQAAIIRSARIGRMTLADGTYRAELESATQALDRCGGRRYRRRCDAELGDLRCGFDLSAPGFTAVGSIADLEAAGTFRVTGLDGYADDWFTQGILTWTSGALAGTTERVAQHRRAGTNVTIASWSRFRPSPVPGDGFTIVAGCDKRFSTCRTKFANQVNFRGFPHLPGNDAAYAYATDGQVFDGGALVS